jgi:ABC-type glycerol-3-phosphate transport system substrate-binding protein
MKAFYMFTAGLLVAALGAVGCSKPSDSAAPPQSAAPAAVSEHTHGAGPNGGVVFEVGSRHAEFGVDHGQQQVKIVFLGDDEKTPTGVGATEFVLNIQATKTAEGTVVAPMTIMMTPIDAADGKAITFVGTDPGIGNVADFAGTLSGEIDGKPAMGEFAE